MPNSPRIVYLTAGAAGMYCGSCMHDNTLARALGQAGVDVELLPLYTPIRTDEKDVSYHRVFFGGISVYLRHRLPWLSVLPGRITRLFDGKWLLESIAAYGIETDAAQLGSLTVAMLRAPAGPLRAEVDLLCSWLERHPPDLIVLSNMLIAGSLPEIKHRLGAPVLVTLQGDDVFLDALPDPYREQAIAEMQRISQYVDGFLVHSQFYAEHMSAYLGIPPERIHRVPLGIDPSGLVPEAPQQTPERPPTIGYLARIDPVKGLDLLIEALLLVRQRPGLEGTQLKIAGWLGREHRKWLERLLARGEGIEYVGVVGRPGKAALLAGIDVLSVPTRHPDPKGLFVLEALTTGVPVVQPEHGAFPELLAATGGGKLFAPGNAEHLAEVLAELLADAPARQALGAEGRQRVHQDFHPAAMAAGTLAVLKRFLPEEG